MYKKDENGENCIIFAFNQTVDAPGQAIQLLPFGLVKTDKGEFLVDELAMQEIIKAFSQQVNDVVIDYEHQTLDGGIAPAAGWIKALENRGQDGLWAKVEWTPRAQEFLKNKEYRYISPVIFKRLSDGRVVYLHSAGLTNTPSIDGMKPIINKAGMDRKGGNDVNFLEQIALKLGLKETATQEEVLQALDKLTGTQMHAFKQALSLLELGENATADEIKGKIIALKNPSGYVRIEEFNKLKEKLDLKERDELVTLALNEGKITPAQKEWAEAMALKDPSGFRSFLATAPQVVMVNKDVGGGSTKQPSTNADEVQLVVNKMLGISDDDFKKYA